MLADIFCSLLLCAHAFTACLHAVVLGVSLVPLRVSLLGVIVYSNSLVLLESGYSSHPLPHANLASPRPDHKRTTDTVSNLLPRCYVRMHARSCHATGLGLRGSGATPRKFLSVLRGGQPLWAASAGGGTAATSRATGTACLSSPRTRTLALWTRSGCARH